MVQLTQKTFDHSVTIEPIRDRPLATYHPVLATSGSAVIRPLAASHSNAA